MLIDNLLMKSAGKLAASYIKGVQNKGIAATIKHFVGKCSLLRHMPRVWRFHTSKLFAVRVAKHQLPRIQCWLQKPIGYSMSAGLFDVPELGGFF